jgi:hypothetical protein
MQVIPLTRPFGLTILAFAIATAGWVAFAMQASTSARLVAERDATRVQAAHWQRAAGRAYTAYLKQTAVGPAEVIRIPQGATAGCGRPGIHFDCDASLVYPPEDF